MYCCLTTLPKVSDCVRASPFGGANEKEEVNMRRKLTWLGVLGAVIVITALYAVHVLATPASAFVGTTLALGRFGEIDVFNHFILPNVPQAGHEEHERHKNNIWLSSQKTKGLSDVYVQNNVWQPGGSTGWHTHPGHSLIIVTAGTITAYEGDDLECKPTVYTQGMGFVDPGGGHVHNIGNEGDVVAQTIAVQLIPADQGRRIDVADPGNCHF
jgi:quercetin dioxygenase-like cupin family protein